MSKPKIQCPSCGKEHIYDSAKSFRPFCSERCKLIDLGAWAQEEYAIAESKSESDLNSSDLEKYPTPPTMH